MLYIHICNYCGVCECGVCVCVRVCDCWCCSGRLSVCNLFSFRFVVFRFRFRLSLSFSLAGFFLSLFYSCRLLSLSLLRLSDSIYPSLSLSLYMCLVRSFKELAYLFSWTLNLLARSLLIFFIQALLTALFYVYFSLSLPICLFLSLSPSIYLSLFLCLYVFLIHVS